MKHQHYTEHDTVGDEAIGKEKREDMGELPWARKPGESWSGERGGPEPSFDGKILN